ncbi:glutathione hydrolase 1 proenzyme-like [Onthophagus taurus]|uniref:glutathione hydrolase 1 proenzyme-like n=1 Tax=Onthophagus taurus TaxID=166361 RepID=UPI0039BDFDEA
MMLRTLTKVQVSVLCAILLAGIVVLGVCLGIFLGTEKVIHRGAVVTNGHECAEIGKAIMENGGTAVDAAIAAMLCEGIAMPQSTGLGGGFLMTIYKKSTGKVYSLNAREMAPRDAYADMFEGNSSLASKGGLAIAVPGELRGLWMAHQRFGLLEWEKVLQPTIDLCKNGHLVTDYLARVFKSREAKFLDNPSLREIFIDPETNEAYTAGHMLKRPKLAETLEIIAKEGADALYNGTLTKQFVKDIQDVGGIITEEDMINYSAEWQEPIIVDLPFNQKLYTAPLPGSGVIMAFIVNILKDYLELSEGESVRNLQRIVESFKYGYGKRTELGDTNYIDIEYLLSNITSEEYAKDIRQLIFDNVTYQDPKHYGAKTSLIEDHGTAHISVLSPEGDAVSVTGTINLYFGSEVRSPSTGIILNDEMDDFSAPNITNSFGVPPSPANYIVPGKRPLSSMCPTVIIDDNGDVRMVIGAAGGTKITTSTALVAIRNLWFNIPLEEATLMKRLHHQLFPMSIEFESGFDENIIDGLEEIGHNYTVTPAVDGFAALTAITKLDDEIEAIFDTRRGGSTAFFDL